MSSENYVGIRMAENLRFPGEGSSAQGKPGAIMRGRPPKRKNERFKAPTYSNGDTKLDQPYAECRLPKSAEMKTS